MKKIIYFTLIACLALTSCDKFLTQYPSNQITEGNFYQTDDDFNQAVYSAYARLKGTLSAYITELAYRSDEAYLIDMTTSTQDRYNIDHFQDNPSTAMMATWWNTWYNGIFRCNDVLDHMQGKSLPNGDKYLGELLFIRSWFYFNLYRTFGVVPIVEHRVSPEESAKVPRCTQEAMLALLERDLTQAVDLLPRERSAEVARVTKIAAQALLGKVYLTFAAQQQSVPLYKKAADILAAAMDENPEFGMMPTTLDAFDVNQKMNKEIVFALYYNKTNDNGHGYWWSSSTNVEEDIMNPTETFREIYSNKDNRLPIIKHSIKKTETHYLMPKWNDDYDATYTTQVGNDFPLIRYADIVLMRAEAVGFSAGFSNAIPYLNVTMTRAGLPEIKTISDKDQFIDYLFKERGREFALEGQRWFDMVRLGVAVSYMREIGHSLDEHNLVFPIPNEEIEKVNDPSILWQNPRY